VRCGLVTDASKVAFVLLEVSPLDALRCAAVIGFEDAVLQLSQSWDSSVYNMMATAAVCGTYYFQLPFALFLAEGSATWACQ
jgi:hypothetical protein